MAIFDRLNEAEIARDYTHYGWFCGLVPGYIGKTYSGCPDLCTRNWVPEWCFTFVAALFGAFAWMVETIDPDRTVAWPITISGTIELEADHGAP